MYEECTQLLKAVEDTIQSSRRRRSIFEKLEAEEGKKVTFDKVVLVSDDKK